MPVKWLYVLKDGTVGSASLATATNPIVGRTAFWADDESCKLNVNTASEGTFWDTPMVSVEQESGQITGGDPGTLVNSPKSLSLAGSQPARFEYQRYPGHPATTCLSPVLGWLWGVPASGVATSANLLPQDTTYNAFKEAIYQITAFTPYGAGTSKGATGNTDPGNNKPDPKLAVGTKHLYATVDEMMFKPQRTTGGTAGKSVPNAKVTPSALEKMRFFLSANSRSPELNLYSRPRLTIWPIHDDPNQRTPFDDLFAFTSTISKDPTGDENKDRRYNLTRLDAKSNVNDYTPQNKKMYEYLRSLTGKEVPGFGGKFVTKYGTDREQILTEIFDYIRTVNLVDTGTASRASNVFIPYTPKFYKLGYQESYGRKARSVDWSGQVTPLKITTNGLDTYGLGRFITITEAALIFHRTGTTVPATGKQPTMQAVLALEMGTPMAGYPCIRETYFTKIRAINPLKVKVGTAGSMEDAGLCSNANGPTPPMINICNVPAHEVTFGRAFMPCLGATSSMHYFTEHKAPTDPTAYVDPDNPVTGDPNRNKDWWVFSADNPGDNTRVGIKAFTNTNAASTAYQRGETVKYYPYVTKQIDIPAALPATDSIFTFQECEYEVEIWSGEAPDDKYQSGAFKNSPRAVLVQKVHLKFPAAPVKLPLPVTNGQASFAKRFDGSLDGKGTDWIDAGKDTVRSIELTCNGSSIAKKGDMRLAMARFDVPSNFFEPRDNVDYFSDGSRMVHGLTSSHGEGVNGNTSIPPANQPVTKGILAKGGVRNGKIPNIPGLITKTTGVERSDSGPGDWDRGLSKHEDGAMANKVDEGNVRFDYANGTPAYKLPYFHGRNVEETGQTFFTPNRQLPSAVMFGSLPTGVLAEKGWQTLLFRPDREDSKTHPGAKLPEDHLLLDLFNLPVVEPYAISEPFSTAGKVNMNHVIAPFGYASGSTGKFGTTQMPRSYLRRDTALRGVLKSTYMLTVPTTFADAAHTELPTSLDSSQTANQLRHPINLDKTIEGMDARLNDLNAGLANRPMNLFRSASEICTVDLFPQDLTVSGSWGKFWEDYAQTGDNMRERPYAHIYPRLTTKSNVFTVHMRCQAIKKGPITATNPVDKFDPVKDQVVGEYRGSAIIERFIDPNDPNLANFDQTKDNGIGEKVDGYYKYRIVAMKQFSPH